MDRPPVETITDGKKPAKKEHVNDERYAYCSEPSTSGTQQSASRKRNICEVDGSGSTDGDDEAAGPAPLDWSTALELMTRKRRYENYDRLIRNGDKVVIGYVGFGVRDSAKIHQLQRKYDARVLRNWDDDITHLVVHTGFSKKYKYRSAMYMHAITSHCFIVNFEWVKESLEWGCLVPEFDYIVTDRCGEPTPFISWRVGRGIIDSPMQWAEQSILYFHGFDYCDERYLNVLTWSRRVGFMIAEDVQELDDDRLRLRLVITELASEEMQVSENELMTWLQDFKVIAVHLDWLLKCLYEFKLCGIYPTHLAYDYDEEMIEHADMNGYVFVRKPAQTYNAFV